MFDKLKSLFSDDDKKFKGTGHKLGSAAPPQVSQPKPIPKTPVLTQSNKGLHSGNFPSTSSNANGSTSTFHPPVATVASTASVSSNQQYATAQPPSGPPTQDQSPQKSLNQHVQEEPQPSTEPGTSTTSTTVTSSTQLDDGLVFTLQSSLGLILSDSKHITTFQTLAKILGNICSKPMDLKYRQIKLSNAKVQEEIVSVNGALEFLKACEFELQEGGGSTTQDSGIDSIGVLVLPASTTLTAVEAGWRELSSVMTSNGIPLAMQSQQQQQQQQQVDQASSDSRSNATPLPSSVAVTSLPVPYALSPSTRSDDKAQSISSNSPGGAPPSQQGPPRNTQVILPVVPDTSVPEWFFNLTGSEIKAEYVRMTRDREQSAQFIPRAIRERLAGKHQSGPPPRTATVRVRFPEGVYLQGDFGMSEPLLSVFEWVSAALRSCDITYELVNPTRVPLACTQAAKVKDADLAGSVLNFRATGECVTIYKNTSFLSHGMLQKLKTSY
ncbi:hypothetical protein CEUSTIGMA_g6685.t1 [Chlamydomonas eustigma]|uniref:UBX domain-containing protein n=1 Tax=Chlamydomonas eustigma TaxID=1157962 RepID=A0A250X850_9CHLO|nr:hypothetical protein CEUSTIGMA_g6685.t1 [Chlamydomonas eustigma]|eukprot:GAX79245.1 hypothetical protein CEUSTIGMA_g6685.t1 [Chlamydomonas eustigma]